MKLWKKHIKSCLHSRDETMLVSTIIIIVVVDAVSIIIIRAYHMHTIRLTLSFYTKIVTNIECIFDFLVNVGVISFQWLAKTTNHGPHKPSKKSFEIFVLIFNAMTFCRKIKSFGRHLLYWWRQTLSMRIQWNFHFLFRPQAICWKFFMVWNIKPIIF